MKRDRKHIGSRYVLFGLQIESEIPLPELFEGDPDCIPDVIIEVGHIPVGPEVAEGAQSIDGGALLVIRGGVRFFVRNGSHITVEAPPAASIRNVRLFLLGSAFGLLIHQRHLLPLHANAVEIDGKVIAFSGPSGVGKSTLAAWFIERGFPLVADDVVVVDFEDGIPIVRPGLPRLRLWEFVINAIGRDPGDYHFSFDGDPGLNKRDVLLPEISVTNQPRELVAVVELSRSGPPFERLRGAEAAEALIAQTYRGAFVQIVGSAREHWWSCVRVAKSVAICRACVNFDLAELNRSYEPLLSQVRQVYRNDGDRSD